MNFDGTKKYPAKQETLKAGLYLVATPIGNLRDMSLRALDTLHAVDLIACEDTRMTGKLLQQFEISKPMLSYNDHSDDKKRAKIIAAIEDGQAVALVSDAGMPMISDPGYKLVGELLEAGLAVTSVPGASAPLMALQLSGMPSDCFSFIGFLPNKQAARQAMLRSWKDVPSTLLAFETAPRLIKALADIEAVMGARDVAVTRELTKMYEEVRRGSAGELLAYYEEHGAPKGEIVLVIGPPAAREYGRDELEALLKAALGDMRTKDAAAFVAEKTGAAKSVLYDMALELAGK